MKCSACQNNECDRKYDNRHKCSGKKEKIDCTCTCQVTAAEEIVTSAVSVGLGAAAIAGGVALTVLTGGLFGVAATIGISVASAATVGAGSSLVINPIQKQITGECMTISDSLQDVALGATIGAITGPIGAGGSIASKGASGLVKLGVRAGAGAVAGGVSGAVSETARAIKGEDVSVESFAESIGIGLGAGAIGGTATHIGSNASKAVTSGVAKAATRVGVQVAASTGTNAVMQATINGKVDMKQLVLNAVGQITVATTAEVTQSTAKNTSIYQDNVNQEMINDHVEKMKEELIKADIDPNEYKKQIEAALVDVKKLSPNTISAETNKAEAHGCAQASRQALKSNTELNTILDDTKKAIQEIVANKLQDPNISQATKEQLAAYQKETGQTIKEIQKTNAEVAKISKENVAMSKPAMFGEKNNVHVLHGDRSGDIAVDLSPPNESGMRSADRAVFETQNDKVFFKGATHNHDYNAIPKELHKPDVYDALRPEQINQNSLLRDEDEGHEKTE